MEGINYGWYGEKHQDELFLAQHGMLNESITEADKSSPSLLKKRC